MNGGGACSAAGRAETSMVMREALTRRNQEIELKNPGRVGTGQQISRTPLNSA